MSGQRPTGAAGHVCLQVGQPFNPFGLFNGIFIPEALVKARGISAGAKMTYGRLTRYAGQNGACFPAVPTVAAEIGMGERQTQRYLSELEEKQLVRRVARFSEDGQESNGFEFLWHPIFMNAVTRMTPEGVTDLTPEGVTDSSPKESQCEESQLEEKTDDKRISGYASQKARSAASRPVLCSQDLEGKPSKADAEPESGAFASPLEGGSFSGGWTPEELATVRSRIVLYWGREPEKDFEFSVMLRARGATARAVCDFFDRLFAHKKLQPGGRNAPRNQNWFLAVIENEFTPGHLPETPASSTEEQQGIDAVLLQRGIDAIENK